MDSTPYTVIPNEEGDRRTRWYSGTCQGRRIPSNCVRVEESDTSVTIRFIEDHSTPRVRHQVNVSLEHYNFCMETGERAPVLVAHWQYQNSPTTHLLYVFPPPMDSDPEFYRKFFRYYAYENDMREIANSLTEDMLQSQFGRPDSSPALG